MIKFQPGDKVICIKDSAIEENFNLPKDIVYTVKQVHNKYSIELKGVTLLFDSSRFIRADPDYATISPVIRKIRQMEKRFHANQNI